MRLTTVLFFLTATAWAELQKRDATTVPATTEDGFNLASLSYALANLASATTTGNFANISPPPKALIPEILSVVPLTVVGELIDAQSRSSLASQFKAGTTPAWYSSLPADVKNYMSVVRLQIKDGALTATTGLGYQTTATTGAGATAATATATGSATTSTSTSSGVAARPTVFTAMIGLSVVGLVIAL
ncbi:hypothetical protein N7494_008134 [Penicillium frequentans]|uniref:FAS1 domain-containing protein n=1 Tax=Penicillium frequentans TaxID=3151616 RepID=A0AAD6CTX1_9EURO|nr:hypothetical protein N7494_008134 [Penicillium glabrum]